MVHEDDEFAHDGREGDFGGFARGAKALVKLFEWAIGACGDQGGHVECAPDLAASTTDASSSMPLAAFTRMRCQSCQRRHLPAVERAQFGQLGQNTEGGECAHPGDGFEFLDSLIQGDGLGAQFVELGLDLFEVAFQTPHQALRLPTQNGQRKPLGLLTLGDQDFQQLYTAADQFGQLLFLFGAGRGGFGLQGPAIFGEERRIDRVGLGALAGGPGEMPDPGGVEHADRKISLLQCGNHFAFVAASGLTNQVDGVVVGEELQEPAVARRGVGQIVATTGQMELQVLLGNIQARIKSGHGVLAHSCKYELALIGRSINGSSLGHRDGRLLLPAHLVKSQCQRVTSSSAPLSCRLQAAGQFPLPKPSFQDKCRGNLRYKRAGVRVSVNLISSRPQGPSKVGGWAAFNHGG
jgi:hypothetical protein